jgi:hypothetical protein
VYLSPDGGVSWVVSESNVHSDEKEVASRLQEEQRYVGAALLGAHDAARALAALRPLGPVRTTIVRDERPFHVITDARFERIDRVLERLFMKAGIHSIASFVDDADSMTLRVRLDFSAQNEPDDAVDALTDIEHFRFVLTAGRFSDATGFDVSDSSATFSREWLDRADKAYEEKRPIEFALSWMR